MDELILKESDFYQKVTIRFSILNKDGHILDKDFEIYNTTDVNYMVGYLQAVIDNGYTIRLSD